MRLSELAAALGLEPEGQDVEITGLAGLEDAGPGDLSFATGPRWIQAFEASGASAFLLPPDFDALGRPCLRALAPYADFARAIDHLMPGPPRPEPGVHPTAVVAEDVEVGDGASIGPLCVVGSGTRIGARTILHPQVTVYPDCRIGEDCVVHSGAHLREGTTLGDRVLVQNGVVLGGEGFGYAYTLDGGRVLIPHRCPVELGDDVDVGSNTTIDASHPGQARFGGANVRTRIGSAVKIDSLVQVGHGCTVGEHGTLCALTGIAGSTHIGRRVLFAGQSASAGHLEVGDGAMIGARGGVARDVEPGAQLTGTPAMERRAWGRFVVLRRRIPELFRRVRALEVRLGVGTEGDDG